MRVDVHPPILDDLILDAANLSDGVNVADRARTTLRQPAPHLGTAPPCRVPPDLFKEATMSDPIDALMAEVVRRRTEEKPFRVIATEVFQASVDRLDSDTLNELKDTGRTFVAQSRAAGITMWRLTDDVPELEFPDDDDLDQLVWIGFLVIATERAGASMTLAAAVGDRNAGAGP